MVFLVLIISFLDSDHDDDQRAMAEAKVLHRGIRRLAGWAVWSFFSEIQVIGGDNVPEDGPLIVCVHLLFHLVPFEADSVALHSAATHHNMMLDPAVLCAFISGSSRVKCD